MMTAKYILDADHQPRREPDLLTWARWYETADRRVALTECGEVRISTVFLSLPLLDDQGPPLLFETMVFGGSTDRDAEHYSTWDEAVAGHEKIVREVKRSDATGRTP